MFLTIPVCFLIGFFRSRRKASIWVTTVAFLVVICLSGCDTLKHETGENTELSEDNIRTVSDEQTNIETDPELPSEEETKDIQDDQIIMEGEPDVLDAIEYEGTFASYQEAYKEIADNVPEDKKNITDFYLIYFNDDDIPDLIVDENMYIFKDGIVYCLKFGFPIYDTGYLEKQGIMGYWDYHDKIDEYTFFKLNEDYGLQKVGGYSKSVSDDKCEYWDYTGKQLQITEIKNLVDDYLNESKQSNSYDIGYSELLFYLGLYENHEDLNAKYMIVDSSHNIDHQLFVEQYDQIVDLYEKFRNNTVKLYFDNSSNVTPYGPAFCMSDGYTLSELEEIIYLHYNLEWRDDATQIDFNYLDCGMDGIPEMAIEFKGVGIYSTNDDSTLVLVIKEENGQLQCRYRYETWARSAAVLNRAGVVATWGTSGAAYHSGEVGILDADVKLKWIYSLSETYCSPEYESDLAAISGTDMYQCYITMDGEEYLCYISDDPNTSNDKLYQIMCEDENLKALNMTRDDICHPEEITQLREKVLEKYGCTKSCLEADQVFAADYGGYNIIDEVFGNWNY